MLKPPSSLSLAATLLPLIGCAQMQAQREGEAAVAELRSCNDAASNSPEAAPLRSRLSRRPAATTLEQISNPLYVSEQEKSAILATQPRYHAGRSAFLASTSRQAPSVVPIYTGRAAAEKGVQHERRPHSRMLS